MKNEDSKIEGAKVYVKYPVTPDKLIAFLREGFKVEKLHNVDSPEDYIIVISEKV